MKLYYHHVGKPGAARDFPRTVYESHPVTILDEQIPDALPGRNELIRAVRTSFPEGHFNCWGVPAGAQRVIENLAAGDVVLLVESVQWRDCPVPALCKVKVFHPIQLHRLSEYLWTDLKYPYIFFFETQRLNLTWLKMLEELGFEHNFDPRGRFYSVAETRLDRFGGAAGYVEHLIASYAH